MRLKCLCATLMLILWIISPAAAQERRPLGEFNAGYSMFTDFDIVGHGFNLGIVGNALSWFGVEGQVDFWFDVGNTGINIYSTTGGPRFAFRTRSVTPFLHVLFGATYARFNGKQDNEFAMKWGGGVDFNFGRHYAWRLEVNDLVHVRPWNHNFNASTSFVYRWQ